MSTHTSQTPEQEAAPATGDAGTTSLFTVPLAADRSDANTVIAGPKTTAAASAQNDAITPQPGERPRIRWAAIVWGLLFAAVSAGTLAILLRPASRDAFGEWAFALSPLTVTLYGLLVLGALVLVAGLAGLLRRAQRRHTQG